MQGKITLITPPDIYENRELGVLFIHLNEDDQDRVSKWLSTASVDQNLNFYVYNGEVDVGWLLWAAGCCTYKYIDLDNTNYISKAISGYLLSKNDFYYKVTDENLAAVYSHINNNRITDIEAFLERLLSGQNT